MAISVNSNQSALTVLQTLNKLNGDAAGVQARGDAGRASEAKPVSTPRDQAAVWSIAQDSRSGLNAISTVKASLDRATSISDVALSAGKQVSSLLTQMRDKAVSAQDDSLSAEDRQSLDADFQGMLKSLGAVVNNAGFDGANLLDGSLTSGVSFIADAGGDASITLDPQDLSLGGQANTLTADDSIATPTLAEDVLARLDASLASVGAAVDAIGAQARQVSSHNAFVSKLGDVLGAENGAVNLNKDGARLQALQIKQQLSEQAFPIVNSGPQVILSLFKGS